MEKHEQEQTQPNEQEHKQHPHANEKQELENPNPNPNPPPELNSPPREQTNPSSPPKPFSPPRLPYQDHNSKPQYRSPPLDSPSQEQREQDDYKKPPPFSPPSIAAAVDSKEGPTSHEVNDIEHGHRGRGGGDGHVDTGRGRRYLRAHLSSLKKAQRDGMLKRALIVSRIGGFFFSLVSFSVLAADRDRGWAVDSFYRYKELRYCMAVNVIVFVYSGFQGYDLVYQLTSGKHKLWQPVRYYLDFSVDQFMVLDNLTVGFRDQAPEIPQMGVEKATVQAIGFFMLFNEMILQALLFLIYWSGTLNSFLYIQILTYLLISASSSAAVRVDDWQSNWGKDEFPEMARASVALSFLAFVALALSSLISGYTLCTLKSI